MKIVPLRTTVDVFSEIGTPNSITSADAALSSDRSLESPLMALSGH